MRTVETSAVAQAVFDNLPQAVFVTDDNARCVKANPAAGELTGYDQDELRQLSILDLIDAPGAKDAPEGWQSGLAAGGTRRERLLRKKDGSAVAVELALIPDIAPGVHLCTMRHISPPGETAKSLRDSERLLSTITANFPRAYLSVINRDLTIGMTDGGAFYRRGLDPKSFIGLHVSDVFGTYGDEVVATVAGAYQDAFAGKSQSFELILDDEYQAFRTVPLVNDAGEIAQILAIVQNITERKRTEKRLREMNEKLQVAISASRLGVHEHAVPPEGEIYLSERWVQILGYTLAEIPPPGERVEWAESRVYPDDLPDLRRAFAGFVAGELPTFHAEFQMQHKSGQWIYVRGLYQAMERNEAGVITRVLGVLEDITARKVREEDLRETNEQLRALIEAAPVAIVHISAGGDVMLWSPAAERLYGWTVEEVLGRRYPVRVIPELVPETEEIRRRVLAGETIVNVETRQKRKDGTLVDVNMTVAPIYDSAGEVRAIIGLFSDISERKAVEARVAAHNRALAEAQNRLAQSKKLAAIGELIAGVAHELNNPLGAIVLYAQLLQRRGVDATGRNDLEQISEQAQRASKIVQSLLDFARRRRPERKASQVNDLVASSINLLNYRFRTHNITCVTDLDPDLPLIYLDPHQIQQVLVNLLNNAYQALSAQGQPGEIMVRTTVALPIFHGPAHEGEQEVLRITVADDGPGIPPGILPRIFDPFFTTKGDEEGTGLGLSVCHGIVSEHGGHLWAESAPGQGATFFIELPRARPETDEADGDQPGSRSVAATFAGETLTRILVVDDEQSLRRVLRRILEDYGYRVDVASNGEEALEQLRRERYSLILCDVRMPGLDGIGFFKALSAEHPDLTDHLIFITGDTVNEVTARFLEENEVPYLSKPFNLQRLIATVQERL